MIDNATMIFMIATHHDDNETFSVLKDDFIMMTVVTDEMTMIVVTNETMVVVT